MRNRVRHITHTVNSTSNNAKRGKIRFRWYCRPFQPQQQSRRRGATTARHVSCREEKKEPHIIDQGRPRATAPTDILVTSQLLRRTSSSGAPGALLSAAPGRGRTASGMRTTVSDQRVDQQIGRRLKILGRRGVHCAGQKSWTGAKCLGADWRGRTLPEDADGIVERCICDRGVGDRGGFPRFFFAWGKSGSCGVPAGGDAEGVERTEGGRNYSMSIWLGGGCIKAVIFPRFLFPPSSLL